MILFNMCTLISTVFETIFLKNSINIKHIKGQMKFNEIPKEEEWRISIIKELTDVKQKNLNIHSEELNYQE